MLPEDIIEEPEDLDNNEPVMDEELDAKDSHSDYRPVKEVGLLLLH